MVELQMCKDCEIFDSCNGRLLKSPFIVMETIKLFIESQSEKIQFKWEYFNKQPNWFKFFWNTLKSVMPEILEERKKINGDNDR